MSALEPTVVLSRLRDRMRLRGAVLLFCSVLGGAFGLITVLGDSRHSSKGVVAVLGCGLIAAYGFWRVVFVPRWLSHPEDIDRIDRHAPGGGIQIVMTNNKAHTLSVKAGERDEIADALQQRSNEVRLRARVVERYVYGHPMKTVRVQHTFHAPIERVFDVISDHAGYARLPGIKTAKVVTPGTTEPNGLGAVREISLGTAWFREEITGFERPRRMDYRITSSRPLTIEHDGGSVQLEAVGDTTVVTWTSTFRVKVPVIGGLLTRVAARQMRGLFTAGLAKAETLAR